MKLHALGTTLLTITALLGPVTARAEGRHPRYLSARTDLRTAQLLARIQEQPNVHLSLLTADHDMGAAIKEIDQAAALDRKDVADHPAIDTNLSRQDRFRKIVDLLHSARTDIQMEEDNPSAQAWHNVAVKHIDEALNAVRRAAVDAKLDREIGSF